VIGDNLSKSDLEHKISTQAENAVAESLRTPGEKIEVGKRDDKLDGDSFASQLERSHER
jgi:hypothetical protein